MTQLTIEQALQLALQHHQAGRLQEAEQLYRQILAQQPRHAEALHLLGVLANQAGRNDLAVDLIRQAIALKPSFPVAHSNLGKILRDTGHLDEAIAACRQAIALQPDYPDAHYNLGNALHDIGQLDEAIAAFRQAIALNPNDPKAHNNLGATLQDSDRLDEAIVAFRQAIALNPNYPEAHSNLGNALKDKGLLDEAIAMCRRAIALKPDLAEAHNNLGYALREKRHPDKALAACRQAIALKPGLAEAHNNLGNALKDKGQLDEAIAASRQAFALKPDNPLFHSNIIFTLHYHPDSTPQTLHAETKLWNSRYTAGLAKSFPPHTNDRSPHRRLRIGYVSADLCNHAIACFMEPLLTCHDRQQVQVFCYADMKRADQITTRLQQLVPHWHNTTGLSDAQIAQVIRDDQIDILVDLSAHTAHNRLLVFARKPAPVQVTYLAYCSTTGMEAMDYRITDPYLDPRGEELPYYSEKSVWLPETYWCYQANPQAPTVSPLPATRVGHITFGCLNNFCKISPPALAAWSRILKTVPRSRLLLHAAEGDHRQRLLHVLGNDGIDPQRIAFAAKIPLVEYFNLYHGIDIGLDPFPYGGGTTTCDTLWMGVPVVSRAGATAVSRAGLSILSNVGLPELVARSEEQYLQIAVNLANDLPRLTNLRATLRDRMQASPLMDAPRFAADIEAVYRQVWRLWCAANRV